MPSNLNKIHRDIDASEKASQWSFREQFLDTDRLRGVSYGNLALRRQAHLFFSHGVIFALALLGLFWIGSANRGLLFSLFGSGSDEGVALSRNYEVITSVTQLPPPPPIAAPPPAPPKVAAPAAPAAPKVGKIKKVKEDEVPAEQTIATQKELRQAIQSQGATGSDEVPMFVPVEKMPGFLQQKKPRYPEMARIAGIEGKVFVAVLIGEDGEPIKAKIMKRIPADNTVFDEVAIASVMESRYFPGVQNGKAVKVWFTVPIRFRLD